MLRLDATTDRFLQGTLDDIRASFVTISHASQLIGTDLGDLLTRESAQALQLIESFELAAHNNFGQLMLPLEPVALSAIVQDSLHALWPMAKKSGVELRLSLAGKYTPVMAHQTALLQAMNSIGRALIEYATLSDTREPLVFGVHKTPGGIAAGVFTTQEISEGLSAMSLRSGKALIGKAKAPIASFSSSASSGLLLADSLLVSMHTHVRIGRHGKGWGLATTLKPSRQLAFI